MRIFYGEMFEVFTLYLFMRATCHGHLEVCVSTPPMILSMLFVILYVELFQRTPHFLRRLFLGLFVVVVDGVVDEETVTVVKLCILRNFEGIGNFILTIFIVQCLLDDFLTFRSFGKTIGRLFNRIHAVLPET